MKLSNKSFLVAAAIATTVGVSGLGLSAVHAAGQMKGGNGPFAGLAEALAAKFNLNVTDVQEVMKAQMETEHAKMGAKMQAHLAERLATAVTDGKLTQAQADAIAAKLAEAKPVMIKGDASVSPEDMKAKMEAHYTELKAWAASQGLTEEQLREFMGGPVFMHRGPGGPEVKGEWSGKKGPGRFNVKFHKESAEAAS